MCSLKHDNEQLCMEVRTPNAEQQRYSTYYGSAQVGHLYFFGSEPHTLQSTSDIPYKLCKDQEDWGIS